MGPETRERTMRTFIQCISIVGLVAICIAPAWSNDAPPEMLRYVRPAGAKFATECEFVINRDKAGWDIISRTDRGTIKMEVEARYDTEDRLTSAKAALTSGDSTKKVAVKAKEGKATVERDGTGPAEFEIPKGTIVTSAPDWSDVFLLCRRYDRTRKGKQEFPALWIHPEKPARRLTFSIEWQGSDSIERDGKKVDLGRYQIRIRDGSAYAAWADGEGRMIRLIPLPAKGATGGFTLEGYEKSAAELRPRE